MKFLAGDALASAIIGVDPRVGFGSDRGRGGFGMTQLALHNPRTPSARTIRGFGRLELPPKAFLRLSHLHWTCCSWQFLKTWKHVAQPWRCLPLHMPAILVILVTYFGKHLTSLSWQNSGANQTMHYAFAARTRPHELHEIQAGDIKRPCSLSH